MTIKWDKNPRLKELSQFFFYFINDFLFKSICCFTNDNKIIRKKFFAV